MKPALQKQQPELFYKKSILKNFAKLAGKHLCQNIFFDKFAGVFTEHRVTASDSL